MNPPRPEHRPTQTLRLRAPSDILAAIPYVVGYHPTDSVVVLGMHGRRLTFTARDDLPATADLDAVGHRVGHLLEVVQRQHCTGVLIVGLGEADRVDPVVHGLREAYEAVGLFVQEILRAHDGRYWSYLCASPTCCPPEGVAYDAVASPIAAAWTVAGRVARRNRSEYEAQLAAVDGPARAAMAEATTAGFDRLMVLLSAASDEAAAEAALRTAGFTAVHAATAHHAAGGRLSDEEVGWLTVLLLHTEVRDRALALIHGTVDELEQHRTLWMDVLRRCEPDLVAAPATLYGFAAWRCGDGGLARLALERSLGQEPHDQLTNRLYRALAHGVPPSAFDHAQAQAGLPDLLVTPRRGPRRRRRSSKSRAGNPRG